MTWPPARWRSGSAGRSPATPWTAARSTRSPPGPGPPWPRAGRLIRRELRAEHVEVLAPPDRAPTGLMTRWRPAPGRARVVYHRGGSAGAQLQAADIPREVIAGAAAVHVTGITPALGDGPAAAVTRAVALARAAGVPVSLDVNCRQALWSRDQAAAVIGALLPGCDVVFAGRDEAEMLTGEADPEAAARALEARGPGQVIITLGAEGCLARIGGSTLAVAALVVTVIDTVGAGDAFVAGYLTELIEDRPPAVRLVTAVTAGALAVTAAGDWEGMPDRDALALLAAVEPVSR
ncbi:MAG TPA: sugar kinase [Solirubrobacteraceae bacterium]|nr:sugar kinase [Solirubrobacteraceae bacterium]